MSTLISCATGNFLTAGTWALVDSTSLLDSEAANTALTTSYVESAAFTPNAITIDGIAVKLSSRATGTPSNTISVRLALAGVTVTGTEVTINVSDLDPCLSGATVTANEGGWYLFKFVAPVLLVISTAYTVSAKLSATTTAVNLYRDATAANWSRMLRTTTTQAPVAGNTLHVLGEHTGAGAGNTLTVTQNNIDTTDYGPGGAAGTVGLTIGKRGILTSGITAATNYNLRLSGDLIVYSGAQLDMGTVANPIPVASTTSWLEFDCVADGDFGLIIRNGCTYIHQGQPRTVGKAISWCLLNTNEAVNSTVLGVDTDTGWLDNDVIVVASTSRTYTECEKGTMNGNASATELTVDGFAGTGGGVAYAHSGTSPTQAEVGNLTRNTGVRSTSSTIMSYINIKPTATVDIDWAEFYWLGENATSKRGITIETTTGSVNIQYSSIHDCEDAGVYLTGTDYVIFSENVLWNCDSIIIGNGALYISSAATNTNTFDHNLFLFSPSNVGVRNVSGAITFTNNHIAGIQSGNQANSSGGFIQGSTFANVTGIFTNNIVHSCAGVGLASSSSSGVSPFSSGIFSGFTVWRCNNVGISATYHFGNITLNNLIAFGNNGSNMALGTANVNTILQNIILNGDSSFSTTTGLSIPASYAFVDIVLENCNFGTASGIKTTHTQDILVGANAFVNATLINTILASTSEISGMTGTIPNSYIGSQKHDQTLQLHKGLLTYGTYIIDTVIPGGGAFSTRMIPSNATNKMELTCLEDIVASAGNRTVAVDVRESVVGDGTDYNGSRIELVAKQNVAIGIAADTVLATATVASEGAFQTISGSLTGAGLTITDDGAVEFVIRCSGTTGWINFKNVVPS